MQSEKKKKTPVTLNSSISCLAKEISHLQCIQNCVPFSLALGLALFHASFFGIMFSVLSFPFFQQCLSFSAEALIFLSSTLFCDFLCFSLSFIFSVPITHCLSKMTKGHFGKKVVLMFLGDSNSVVSIYTCLTVIIALSCPY